MTENEVLFHLWETHEKHSQNNCSSRLIAKRYLFSNGVAFHHLHFGLVSLLCSHRQQLIFCNFLLEKREERNTPSLRQETSDNKSLITRWLLLLSFLYRHGQLWCCRIGIQYGLVFFWIKHTWFNFQMSEQSNNQTILNTSYSGP